jgi:hypothetical protein
MKKYGMTEVEYKTMIMLQSNSCKICGQEFTGKIRAVIDHDHKTGKVRGILCDLCNRAEGHLKTSNIALAMYQYMLAAEIPC